MDIVNFEDSQAKWIYLSYQHGEHYGSVREVTELQSSVRTSAKEVVEPSSVLANDTLIQSISRSHQLSPKQVVDWYSVFKGNVELTNKWLKLSKEVKSSKSAVNLVDLKGSNEKPYHVKTLSDLFVSSKNKKTSKRGNSNSSCR